MSSHEKGGGVRGVKQWIRMVTECKIVILTGTGGTQPSIQCPQCLGITANYIITYLRTFRENLPGHFKFKEYCPRVFHDLRKRFGFDDVEYMVC